MRNKLTKLEAAAIGAQIRDARVRSMQSMQELGAAIGVHHSQVSRCERGDFKTISKNVQTICKSLGVSHPKLLPGASAPDSLRKRFVALLETVPGSAGAFERLFDLLESSAAERMTRGKSRDA